MPTDDKPAPAAASHPPPGPSLPAGEEERYDIRIARDGTWFHEGAPIRRPELVRLFASVLRRDDAGRYWLVTPAERGRIVVEDVPFIAVEMSVCCEREEPVVRFRTNLDESVEAGPDHPIRMVEDPQTGEAIPYIEVRKGLEARVTRSVYYEMVERSERRRIGREDEVGLWSRGTFFVLGRLPSD